MTDAVAELLAQNLAAAELVGARLARSLTRLERLFPLAAPRLAQLDEQAVESIDAFIKRFEQLQDIIASRIFRGIAILEQEEVAHLSKRDLTLLMEKLGVLPSADEWTRLAIARNQLAHDYPDQPQRQAAHLNGAFAAAPALLRTLEQAGGYARRKGLL